MRVFSIVAMICTAAAVILSMLSLFAGWQPNFIEDADIMVLDISKLLRNQTAQETAITYEQSGNIGASGTMLADSNEWYSVHMMNYCFGNYTSGSSRSLSGCSKSTAFFSINPISLASSKSAGPFEVSFSQTITDVGGKIENAYQAVFFFLCTGIAATGLCFIFGTIVAIVDASRFTHGTRVSLVNLVLSGVKSSHAPCTKDVFTAFLGLGLSCGVVTGVLVETVEKVNGLGADVGISAARGDKFLWMAWSSAALMLVVTVVWFMDYYVERKLVLREIEQMYAAGAFGRNAGLRRQSIMGPEMGRDVSPATAKYHKKFVTEVAKDALAHAAGAAVFGGVSKVV
ncbi:sur7 protein [Diplodia corticola]|uniref:Sur7 protein n=1 Tax=Diplodia corticola TaxID=236234 RepID=A0A1J9RBR1_9PEZI|nr:sur7 protein [Diplodia corticola]OJD37897.1 sur7 protein [Diplodia corticola]